MADKKTEAEWEKSKRIEAEKMKAARALAAEKNDTNVAYLEPKMTKVKGWSNDPNVILASAERIGDKMVVLALAGVVFGIIGILGGIVVETFQLGLAGMMISGLPDGVSFLCFGIAVLMAIVVIGSEIVYKIKNKRKFSPALWSAVAAIIITALYALVYWLIIRFS